MLNRDWRMPRGLFRRIGSRAGELGKSWHPGGRWLEIGATRLHCVVVGRGPALILLHGFAQSSWCWRKNIAALARYFTVVAPCALGCGWSAKPATASYRLVARAERTVALMDALGVERAHMCGNSLGGALALHIAATAAERVGRIVLVNPATAGRYPMAQVASLMHECLGPAFALPGISAGLWLGLRAAAYNGMAVDAEYMRRFLAPLADEGAVVATLAMARYYNRDLRALDQRLAAVEAPCLLMLGHHDRIMPPAVSGQIARKLANVRTVTYADSGHCPHEEEPERFCRDVIAFLSES